MAANFHESSQCRKWLMVRRELEERRSADFRYLSTKEYIKLNVYYGSVMQAIAKRLQLRQIVVASAQVYFKRFYTRNSFRILDPLLLCATCIYVGSKIEESPQHIKNVATEAKNVANEMKISGGFPFDPSNIAECEFYLLEDLDFYMILYHAYRPLTSYLDYLNKDRDLRQLAWSVVNDLYRTDTPLLYAPSSIALAAIFFACSLQKDKVKTEELKAWFSNVNADVSVIPYIVQDLLDLYQVLRDYKIEDMPTLVAKMKVLEPSSERAATKSQRTPGKITTAASDKSSKSKSVSLSQSIIGMTSASTTTGSIASAKHGGISQVQSDTRLHPSSTFGNLSVTASPFYLGPINVESNTFDFGGVTAMSLSSAPTASYHRGLGMPVTTTGPTPASLLKMGLPSQGMFYGSGYVGSSSVSAPTINVSHHGPSSSLQDLQLQQEQIQRQMSLMQSLPAQHLQSTTGGLGRTGDQLQQQFVVQQPPQQKQDRDRRNQR